MLKSRDAAKYLWVCGRNFSTGTRLCGRKSRDPFDKRFPVYGRHLGPRVKGGTRELSRRLAASNVYIPGYIDKESQIFRTVPEMIPEFVVPELDNFELKPYVSYKVPEVIQSKFTAKNLFDACYAEKLADCYTQGKLTKEEMERILQLSPTNKQKPEESE